MLILSEQILEVEIFHPELLYWSKWGILGGGQDIHPLFELHIILPLPLVIIFDIFHLILLVFDGIAQILNVIMQLQLLLFHVGDVLIEFFDLLFTLLDFDRE